MEKFTVVRMVAKESGVNIETSTQVINSLIKVITRVVASGDKVIFRGFGTFEMRLNAGRKAFNFSTQEVESIPPKYSPKFKPGKDFIEAVSKVEVDLDE